jgi:hypothetical protein
MELQQNPGSPFRNLSPSEDLISHLKIEMSLINILVGTSINIEADPSIFHGIESAELETRGVGILADMAGRLGAASASLGLDVDSNYGKTFASRQLMTCACSTKPTMLSSSKMIFRLANRSSNALPTRTTQLLRRHQSTAPARATPSQSLQAQQLEARQRQQLIAQQILAQQLQSQQSPVAEIAKHPSAVSHPALSEQPTQRGGGDNSIVFIFGGLLLGGIPLSYWYWGYRQRAMRQKKEEMLRGIQERYAARHGGG